MDKTITFYTASKFEMDFTTFKDMYGSQFDDADYPALWNAMVTIAQRKVDGNGEICIKFDYQKHFSECCEKIERILESAMDMTDIKEKCD